MTGKWDVLYIKKNMFMFFQSVYLIPVIMNVQSKRLVYICLEHLPILLYPQEI